MSQIIAGRHAVYHAVKAGRRKVLQLWLLSGIDEKPLADLLALANDRGIPIDRVDKPFFAKNVDVQTHQGVAARVSALEYLSLDSLIDAVDPRSAPRRLLLLDEIQDPHNLGALLRSALCFGICGVLITRHRSAPLSPAAVKAAAGAVEYLHLGLVPSLPQPIDRLKKADFWIYGAVVEEGISCWDQDYPDTAALVIGGEARGLHRLVKEKCDCLISIPCQGPLGSLNASVAGAILMAAFKPAVKVKNSST